MQTARPKAPEPEQRWLVVDAKGQRLGRLASRIAILLRGKHKAIFAPHLDTGDHVVVVNAKELVLTGRKPEQKVYTRYSGYPGGLTRVPFRQVWERGPEAVLRHAVEGMLPSNRLGRKIRGKLHIYAGASHPHAAQAPEALVTGLPKLHD